MELTDLEPTALLMDEEPEMVFVNTLTWPEGPVPTLDDTLIGLEPALEMELTGPEPKTVLLAKEPEASLEAILIPLDAILETTLGVFVPTLDTKLMGLDLTLEMPLTGPDIRVALSGMECEASLEAVPTPLDVTLELGEMGPVPIADTKLVGTDPTLDIPLTGPELPLILVGSVPVTTFDAMPDTTDVGLELKPKLTGPVPSLDTALTGTVPAFET